MTSIPTIGICIPTRNQAGTLAETLHSAFAQTRAPIDVIVCDDAGSDDTPAVIDTFRAQLPADQRAILRYVRHPQALGIGGNFDFAVRAAHGTYCVKVDSDDVLEPTYIETLAALLDAHPQAGWAHCNVLNIHPDGRPISLAHNRKRSGFAPPPQVFQSYLHHNDTCHCVLIRRAAYETAGGYRPVMRTCEDWLLWLEMCLAGFGNVYCEHPLARMRKYHDRQELMARRRLDFVDAAARMLATMESSLTEARAHTLGVSPASAITTLRNSVAGQVRYAVLHEADPAVRTRLLDAIIQFAPTPRNRLWCQAARRLPPPLMRLPTQLDAAARHVARKTLQLFRG